MSNADYAVRCQVCDEPVEDQNGEQLREYCYIDTCGMWPICLACIVDESEMEQ